MLFLIPVLLAKKYKCCNDYLGNTYVLFLNVRSYTFHITKVVQVNNEQRVAMQFLMCKMMTSFVSSVLTKATQQQQRKMHRNDKTAAFADQFHQHCRHCLLLLRSLRKAFFTRSGRVFYWPSKTALKVLKVDYRGQKINSGFDKGLGTINLRRATTMQCKAKSSESIQIK